MTCNCLEEVEEEIKKLILKEISDEIGFQKITSSRFKHLPFLILDSKVSQKIAMPFIVEYERKAKTSGKVRTYKKETNIFPSFCPFCGVKYDEES